jgi:branched-chain amino acid transport system ATP-binding protein
MTAGEPILQCEGLSLSFGGVQALQDIAFSVRNGEILGIIGPNGAGKTCLMNCITGFYHPQQGRIYYQGTDITDLPSHRRAKLGIARVFQNVALYTGLSTADNLMAARHIWMKSGVLAGAIYWGLAQKEDVKHRKVVEEIIDFLEMEQIRDVITGTLPYGFQKRVDLGRALAMEPKLLLLDEPVAGMSTDEKEDIARFILDIHQSKEISIILVEHDMGLVMDIVDRIVVLDFGCRIAEGVPQEITSDPKVIGAYLGGEDLYKKLEL